MKRNMTKMKKPDTPLTPHRNGPRIKRNQPCPCGSGRKAKHCCLNRIKTLESIPPRLRERLIIDSILQQPFGTVDEDIKPMVKPVTECQIEIKEQP